MRKPSHLTLITLGLTVLFCSHFPVRAQTIDTVAGGGPNNVPAVSANLADPYDVLVASTGGFYVVDAEFSRIFKVDTSGQLTVVAGVGLDTFSFLDDGGLATNAALDTPRGIALDSAGNLFIADANNQRIRRVDAVTGIITTVAGSGSNVGGFSGDGGPATSARLNGFDRDVM